MRGKENDYECYSLRQLSILAGIISPVCILLSIPPLTGDWITDPDENYIVSRSESQFLPNSNILSQLYTGVFFLFCAQISLILRFFDCRIILNTWISIIGFLLNAILTSSSIIYYNRDLQIPDGKVFSDEYYSTYASITLSFASFLILVVDYFKNNGLRRGKGGGLSRNQRILILVFILVTIWTIVGALAMRAFQNYTFVRGVYFSLVTMTTIGFGDLHPKSDSARGFNIFFASVGIILIGMLIAFIHSVILDYFEAFYIQQLSKIRSIGLENFYTLTIQTFSKSPKKAEEGESRKARRVTTIQQMDDQEKELQKFQLSQYLKQLSFSIITLLLFWLIGAAIFCALEDWDYFTGVYFCFISFTTIGYGDIIVKPINSIIVFCVYSLLGIPTMAYFISVSIQLFSNLIETHSDKIEKKRMLKSLNPLTRRLSIALSINEEVDNDLELLKALEIKTESEEIDILNKLLTMTEFYNGELSDYFKANRDDGDQLNQLQCEKISKYEEIFTHLIEACSEMNLNTSPNTPSIKSQ